MSDSFLDTSEDKLKQMAAEDGHFIEEEARRILDRAVSQEGKKQLGTEIAQMFAELGGC